MTLDINQKPDPFGGGGIEGERWSRETSCIEAPVILDQLQLRECVTRNIALSPLPENDHPSFKFKGAKDFKIVDLKVLNKACFKNRADNKKVNLLIIIRYNLIYSDGLQELAQPDEACFEFWIDKIKCPGRNIKMFRKSNTGKYLSVKSVERPRFTAQAIAQTFGEVICSNTGALIIDLGVFFLIKIMCITQLFVPSVDYCASSGECASCDEKEKNAALKAKDEQIFS